MLPGRSLLRGVAGRVRLHLRDPDHAGRRRACRRSSRRRSRSRPPRRCRSSGRSSGASGPRRARSRVARPRSRARWRFARGVRRRRRRNDRRRDHDRPVDEHDGRSEHAGAGHQADKPPPGYRLTASRSSGSRRRRRRSRPSCAATRDAVPYEYTQGPGPLAGQLVLAGPAQGDRRRSTSTTPPARSPRRGPAFRSRGRWRAATRARSAATSTRSYVWLPLCVLFFAPFLALAPAARRCCTSTCSCCSASRSRWRSSTTREIGLSVPLAYPPLLYLLARMLLLGVRDAGGRARAAAAARAGAVAGARRRLPGRLPRRAERDRLERDRRRLRGRDRRRQARPRPAAVRRLARRTTNTATPTARSTTRPTSRSSRSSAGAAPGTTCRPRTPRRSSSTC